MKNIKIFKMKRLWNYLFLVLLFCALSFLGKINAEASFGRHPYRYGDLTEGHKMFLAEVAQHKGYLAYPDMNFLSQDLLAAFRDMRSAAAKSGIRLSIVSGYRNYNNQVELFFKRSNVRKPINKFYSDKLTEPQRKLVKQQYLGRSEIVAPPGFSEHSTGLAIDINTISFDFANTRTYRWLQQHAQEFGFTLSYPKNYTGGTIFEPWHWRFDGNAKYNNSTPLTSLVKLPESPRRPFEERWDERYRNNNDDFKSAE
ncbi:MAG TPA: M15 family metallopeptidase [Coleofasciculaceae cyanobacterium]|jgi:LAS superfamily LD-carboxypeptidase LdcB